MFKSIKLTGYFDVGEEDADGVVAGAAWFELDVKLFIAMWVR